jgi:hypothetical protein
MIRRRLSTRQREQLYEDEAAKAIAAGRGHYPICNICSFPILRGREWDESHDPSKPRWLGGAVTGIAHRKCNRDHNHTTDTPLFAKNERMRKRDLDFKRSSNPLPGGRYDSIRKTMSGRVVDRSTGQPWGSRR